MSPRAAWRLETLGFRSVYDYGGGKQNWLSAGLPTEGEDAREPRAGAVARADVPVCSLDESVGEAAERVREIGWDRCVVVNEERVVLGLLREKDLASSDPEASVEGVMRNGPATFRPDEPVGKLAKRMREREASAVVVTTSDGRLVGLLYREDAERLADEQA